MANDKEIAIFWLKQIRESIHGGDEEFDSYRKRAIDIAIKELEKPEERWIPVSERLPENGSDILVYCDDGEESRIVACNYDNGVWFDCVFNTVMVFKHITHWMPLPEPPVMD